MIPYNNQAEWKPDKAFVIYQNREARGLSATNKEDCQYTKDK